jgi:hypothetical protein
MFVDLDTAVEVEYLGDSLLKLASFLMTSYPRSSSSNQKIRKGKILHLKASKGRR